MYAFAPGGPRTRVRLPPPYLPLDRSLFGNDHEARSVEATIRGGAQEDLDALVASLPEAMQARVTTHLEIGSPWEGIVVAATARKHD